MNLLALLLFFSLVALQVQESSASALGFNWGFISHRPLSPEIVVKLLRANNITRVKLFDADRKILSALAGSAIEVMVGISNDMLQPLAASSIATDAWVRANLTDYMGKGGVSFKYIAVGNEPFLTNYGTLYVKYAYQALYNMHQSLVKIGLNDAVKVTVPCNADVIWSTVPSKAQFRPDMKDTMTQIVSFLDEINSPFVVNIYPFLDLIQQANFPEDYAFFDGTSHPVLDGAITYTNAFDASFDMTVVALSSIGFPNMQVIIGEIGWPSDGRIHANISNAKRFNQGLINHIMTKKGTPLRPNVMVDVYLFGLLDENQKSVLPGNFERHWGVFTFDGQAKYQLDLTGEGLNTDLVNADGVSYLPTRWCVAKPTGNASDLASTVEFACSSADCTALADGGSCSNVGAPANVSYAFNSYYQLNSQDASSCFFDGLGVVTFVDPSVGECRFLIGVSLAWVNMHFCASKLIMLLSLLSFFLVI